MTDIERIREWISTFVSSTGQGVPKNFQIDYTSEIAECAGLAPAGQVQSDPYGDIVGNKYLDKTYNFGLYVVLNKPADLDELSSANANWIMEFQDWAQEQSALGLAPTFGNIDIDKEIIKAQNGEYFGEKDAGVGVYMVTINIQFKKKLGGI